MLKKLSLFLIAAVVICSIFVGLDRFFHGKSSQLTAFKVNAFHPPSSEWDVSPLSIEEQRDIDQILNQTFTYYNKGSQAYVFISEDKQYVLKFIKQHTLHPHSWLCYLPFSFNPYYKKYLYRQKRLLDTFKACKVAFTELKEETALVYLHLNPTEGWNRTVTLFDKKGERVEIDIGKACFLVQRKADLIFPRIAELMSHKDSAGAKQIITTVFSLIDILGRKGIVDNDPIIRKNFGLIGDRAVQIDVGKMRIDPSRIPTLAYKWEVRKITGPFRTWIENNYPELLPAFEEAVLGIT